MRIFYLSLCLDIKTKLIINQNRVNCVDINECNNNYGYCSQMTNCLNLNGSAFCFCYNSPILPKISINENNKHNTKHLLTEPSTSLCRQNYFDTFTFIADLTGFKYSDNLIDKSSEFVSFILF